MSSVNAGKKNESQQRNEKVHKDVETCKT